MAVREIYGLAVGNIEVGTDQLIHAGMVIARDTTTGKAIPASRTDIATVPAIGVAADDAVRTGNTLIQADPVGATTVAADGTITANNNAFFVATKRALADYQDETVSNVSDLVSGSTGYQGPRRGMGYYSTPSTQLIIDASVCVLGKACAADATGTTDAENSAWAVNDYLCQGLVGNKGKWVKMNAANTFKKLARIDKIEGTGTGTLVYITLL